jgi:hypothetical protein
MKKLVAILLALISTSTVRGTESPALGELLSARAKWEATASREYAFTIQQYCFCGGHSRLGPARVAVSSGHVVRAIYLGQGSGKYRKGRPLAPDSSDLAVTVPELFKMIESMIRNHDPEHTELVFSFHPELGYPSKIATSNKELEDDFLVYEITDFVLQ